jgi:ribosomal protein S18 acetylase RimI-like enzyme
MQFPLGPDAQLVLAGPGDDAVLLALARAFHAEDNHPLTEAGEEAFRQLLADSSLGLAFKIVRTDRVVGYAALCFGFSIEWGGRDAFLDDLYIHPPQRGRNLGQQTIVQLIAAAHQAGCAALHLEVTADNRAQRLYRRLGFADRGSTFLTRRLRVPQN